jgi:hypothetical protein
MPPSVVAPRREPLLLRGAHGTSEKLAIEIVEFARFLGRERGAVDQVGRGTTLLPTAPARSGKETATVVDGARHMMRTSSARCCFGREIGVDVQRVAAGVGVCGFGRKH